MLSFDEGRTRPPAGAPPHLADAVVRWNDSLLPGLVTATGSGFNRLLIHVRGLIASLEPLGIEAFRLGDLIGPLRSDLRQRWSRIFSGSHGTEERDEEGGVQLCFTDSTSAGFFDRESFRAFERCVADAIDRHRGSSRDREDLRAVWNALVTWAREGAIEAPSGDPVELVPRGAAPSRRELSRWLEIPRDRVSSLFQVLAELAEGCRAGPPRGRGVPPSDAGGTGQDRTTMDRDKRHRDLRKLTAEAATRAEEAARAAHPAGEDLPRPGSVLALAEESETWVEWVVLAPDPESGGLLAAPADLSTLAGRHDLAVAADQPAGPLTVRCAEAAVLPRAAVENARVSRAISSEAVDEALELHRRAAATAGESPSEEAELLPDLTQARERARTSARAVGARPAPRDSTYAPPHSRPVWMGLAAALAAAALGLGIWSLGLKRALDSVDSPSILPREVGWRVLEDDRAPKLIPLPRGADEVVIYLDLSDGVTSCNRFRIELENRAGKVLATLDHETRTSAGEIPLRLPRRFLLGKEPTRLRLSTLCGETPELLEERALEVVVTD